MGSLFLLGLDGIKADKAMMTVVETQRVRDVLRVEATDVFRVVEHGTGKGESDREVGTLDVVTGSHNAFCEDGLLGHRHEGVHELVGTTRRHFT